MSEYDALRKVINHEANQEDDGGFFAKLGGIQPDHDDGPAAKGLFQKINKDAWEKGNPPIWPSTGGIITRAKTQLRKRRTIVKVRRNTSKHWWPKKRNHWRWKCELCGNNGISFFWRLAYNQADRHARNHH